MADITLTVPDALVPRVVAALEKEFPRLGGETNGQYAKRVIVEILKQKVVVIEERDAFTAVDGPARVARVATRRTDLSGIS